MEKLIEKLKDNKVIFDFLSEEEKSIFEKVGKKNCDYYGRDNNGYFGWYECSYNPKFFEASTYRIKENYKYTPPLPTYEEICISLFKGKSFRYIDDMGRIDNSSENVTAEHLIELNNAPTSQQLEKLLYQNKLANIANYLNEGWEADFKDKSFKYCIAFHGDSCEYIIHYASCFIFDVVYFKTLDLAKQAIEIMGKKGLNKAFGIK